MGGVQLVPSKAAFNAEMFVGQSVDEMPKISFNSREIFKQMGVTTVNTHFTKEASRLEAVVEKAEKNQKWYNKASAPVRSLLASAALATFVAACVMGWPIAAIVVPIVAFTLLAVFQMCKEDHSPDMAGAFIGFVGAPVTPLVEMFLDYKASKAFRKQQNELKVQMQKMSESIDESYSKLKARIDSEISNLDKIDVKSVELNQKIANTRDEYKTSLAELDKCKQFYAKFKEGN